MKFEDHSVEDQQLLMEFFERRYEHFKELALKQGFLMSEEDAWNACQSLIENLIVDGLEVKTNGITVKKLSEGFINHFKSEHLHKLLVSELKHGDFEQEVIKHWNSGGIDWERSRELYMARLEKFNA